MFMEFLKNLSSIIFLVSFIAFIVYWRKKVNVKKAAGENYANDENYNNISKVKHIIGIVCFVSFLLAGTIPENSEAKTELQAKEQQHQIDQTAKAEQETAEKPAKEQQRIEEKYTKEAEKQAKEQEKAAYKANKYAEEQEKIAAEANKYAEVDIDILIDDVFEFAMFSEK